MTKYLLLVSLANALGSAQTPLSLRDAVSRALDGNPLVAESSERVSASEALRTQAGFRPNPRFYAQAENLRNYGTPAFRFGNDADAFVYVSQLLETAGKRLLRGEAASSGVRRAQLQRELLRRQIAGRVKMAYWNAAKARKAYELLREDVANFRQVVEYHEARVREGAMAEVDLLRVQLESERLELAANAAALEADRARIDLFREMGETSFPDVTFSEALEETDDAAVQPDAAAALEQRTEIKLARQDVEQANARWRLEKAMGQPDLEFLGGYKRSSGFHTVLAGFQINLPIANRNQGNIAAANSEVRAAQARLASAQALVRAEVNAAGQEYKIRRQQIARLLPALNRHASEASRISLAAYREGGGDLLRLLDSERIRIETQLLYYRTLAEYQQSKVAMELAMGVEP
jgi:cobalt-zinc-cadmium efflux system outer membrane protein